MPHVDKRTHSEAMPRAPFVFAIVAMILYATMAAAKIQLPSPILFGVVAAGFGYLLSLSDIRMGLMLLLMCIGFSPEFSLGGVWNLRIEDFLTPALLLTTVSVLNKDRAEVQGSPLKEPILLFLAVGALSSLLGVVAGTVLPFKTLLVNGKFLEYFVMLFIVMNAVRSQGDLKLILSLSILIACGVGALAGTQRIAALEQGEWGRVSGPAGETSNIMGGFLMCQIALVVGLLACANTVPMRVLYTSLFLILLYPFLHTYSRTSYAALLAGLFFVGVFQRRRILVGLLLIMGALPFLNVPSVLDRALTILDVFGDRAPASWNARVSGWQSFGTSIFQYPLLGKGVGATPFLRVDNDYFRVMIDMGLLGLLAFFWMQIMMLVIGFKTLRKVAGHPLYEGMAVGYTAGVAGLIVHAWGATSFSTIRTMEPLMVMTGLMTVVHNRFEEWTREPELPPPVEDRRMIRTSRVAVK